MNYVFPRHTWKITGKHPLCFPEFLKFCLYFDSKVPSSLTAYSEVMQKAFVS